eukprot:13677_1
MAHKLFNTTNSNELQIYFKQLVGECDSNEKCKSILRHSRQRYIEHDDTHSKGIINAYIDSIHCYLFHDPSTLYRLRHSNSDKANRFTTSSVKSNEKKNNDTKTETKQPDEQLNDLDLGNCSTYFWPKPKFKSWKEELLHNEYASITEEDYDSIYSACKLLENSIRNVDNLSCDEIACIKFYTDFDDLCSEFRKAFRTVRAGDIDDVNKRRSQFKRWAQEFEDLWKYISVKANCSLYHGINCVLAIKSSIPKYYGPVSTSKSIVVSQRFAGHRGMIFHITNTAEGYNVSWISRYPNEQEFLLVSTELPFERCTILKESSVMDLTYLLNHAQSCSFDALVVFLKRYKAMLQV